jgi:hypothetical protein
MTKKIIIEIQDYEDKKSKAGKRYTRFKTQMGWMSAFDDEVIKPLKDLEGKKAECDVAIDEEKGFKNIRAFHQESTDKASNQEEETFEKPEVIKIGDPTEKPKEFHLTAEAVRIGALDSAIKVTKKLGSEDYQKDLFQTFKQFEKWILTGKIE